MGEGSLDDFARNIPVVFLASFSTPSTRTGVCVRVSAVAGGRSRGLGEFRWGAREKCAQFCAHPRTLPSVTERRCRCWRGSQPRVQCGFGSTRSHSVTNRRKLLSLRSGSPFKAWVAGSNPAALTNKLVSFNHLHRTQQATHKLHSFVHNRPFLPRHSLPPSSKRLSLLQQKTGKFSTFSRCRFQRPNGSCFASYAPAQHSSLLLPPLRPASPLRRSNTLTG